MSLERMRLRAWAELLPRFEQARSECYVNEPAAALYTHFGQRKDVLYFDHRARRRPCPTRKAH